MIFIQRLGDLIQLWNKPTTSTKEGKKFGRAKLAQTEGMNTSQTKHKLDVTTLHTTRHDNGAVPR
jgi:hypothetical protein